MNSLSVVARHVCWTIKEGADCLQNSDRQRSRSAPTPFASRLPATTRLSRQSPAGDQHPDRVTHASAGTQFPDDPQESHSVDCTLGALRSGDNMLRASSGSRSKPPAIVVRLLRR